MLLIHFFAITGCVLTGACFWGARSAKGTLRHNTLALFLLTALSIRLLAAALSKGFGSDIACFAAWADRIFQVGPGNFYSPEIFTDYPPGYMYVLWLIGGLRELFGIEYYSIPHLILLKFPAIICDLACGMLLFREASAKRPKYQAFFLCAAYLFHPVIILNSSVWGQVDSVYTLAVIYMCLCLARKKTYSAYIAFCVGVLIKPQMLLFSPVLLAGIIDLVFLNNFSLRKLLHNLFQGLTALVGTLILCLPFGLENVWNQYFSTVGSYPYAAVNACNFWGFFGLNWISQNNTFLGIPYWLIGWIAIFTAITVTLILSLRNRRDTEKYTFLGAFLLLTVFVFSVRMHERYVYPALLLLLFAYVYKPARQTFWLYGALSTMHFYNTAYVLFFYDPSNYDRKSPLLLLVSAGMIACAGLLFHVVFRFYKGESFLRPDLVIILTFTFIYSFFALYDLGDLQAPSTAHNMTQRQSVTLDFGAKTPMKLSYYIAPWHNRTFSLEGATSQGPWRDLGEITLKNVFTWQEIDLPTAPDMTRIRLTLNDTQASLLEFSFSDKNGLVLSPLNTSDYPSLFDESSLYPENSTFRNSMYFDEIYHGRTAYEFINGLTSYENTHPPLGKILIALGVAVFGMNPFGWRITGTLFGIIMVPIVYLFAKKISKNTLAAALACALFTFDFMHFTQTRLATIDVYITFFVMLMYYFMYQYTLLNFYHTPLRKTLLPLGACGVCMGLGIASKWTGVYAGVGLALIFFSVLYQRYLEYRLAKKNPFGNTNGIPNLHIIQNFGPNTKYTIFFCLVFFVVIPAFIYLLSYIPFRDYSDRGLLDRMLVNQKTMFSYHSGLNSTHPYSSSWYEWPIIKRPIWYYSRIVTQTADGGLREGISSFGNPAVWWMGIPAAFYMIYLWLRKKDRTAAFLVIGYLAQYLPWFFVTRITFIYHYFPSVVFVVLMIMYSLVQWKDKLPKRAFLTITLIYGVTAVGLFLLFYSVLSGQPVEASFVTDYLRWFKTWVLTSK